MFFFNAKNHAFIEDEDLISKLFQGKHNVVFLGGEGGKNWPRLLALLDIISPLR